MITESGMIVLGGLELGVKALQIWADYNAELLALQQQRAAEGRQVTQADLDALLAKTHTRLQANHDALVAKLAAKAASIPVINVTSP